MKFLFATLLLLASQLSFASDSFMQDEHYQLLDTPVSQSAQVVEYFSYYCPFCYNFEPIVAELKKSLPTGTPLHKVPVAFLGGNMAATVQRAHATAGLLNIEDAFTAALFNQIHQQRKPPQNRSDITTLFASIGVEQAQLDAQFDSMVVNGAGARHSAAHALQPPEPHDAPAPPAPHTILPASPPGRPGFVRLGHWFDRLMGAVLVGLGIKVAFSELH